jgi:hypothetical protein
MLSVVSLLAINAAAQTSAINYQGRLTDGANNANGTYLMEFALYDAASNGAQVGTTITNNSVSVTNGIFSVELDFGAAAFSGANRWVEVRVKKAADPGFTTLAPRQKITSSPYAIQAASALFATNAGNAQTAVSAATATTAQNVSGVVAVANGGTGSATQNFVDLTTNQTVGGNKNFTGTISGNGSGLTNLNTPTASNFLFSFDNVNRGGFDAANTFQNVLFSQNSNLNGWFHITNTAEFTAQQTGTYFVTYKVNLSSTGTGADINNYTRVTLNSIEVSGSLSAMSTNANVGAINNLPLTNSFVVSIAAGDVLRVQAASSSSTTSITPVGSLAGSTGTSAALTIVKIQ